MNIKPLSHKLAPFKAVLMLIRCLVIARHAQRWQKWLRGTLSVQGSWALFQELPWTCELLAMGLPGRKQVGEPLWDEADTVNKNRGQQNCHGRELLAQTQTASQHPQPGSYSSVNLFCSSFTPKAQFWCVESMKSKLSFTFTCSSCFLKA